MLNLSLMQYNFYIVQPHLFEKFIGYLIRTNSVCLPNFKQIVLHYIANSACNSKKMNVFFFFLHAFLLERLSFHKPLFSLVKESISDFKIISGQLIGFNSILLGKYMYNFIYQYIYNTLYIEKGFNGFSLDRSQYINFGSLNIISQNIFSFPMMDDLLDEFEVIFPECESNLCITFLLSTKNVLCLLIYLSHLQFPLNDIIYYRYY